MKKIIYILLFMLLGVLVQFIVHALVEMVYIKLLLSNWQTFSFGLSWQTWYYTVHTIFTLVLLVAGILFGWQQGKHWWQRIYSTK